MAHRLVCAYCARPYRANRADSTTCSSACRTALHRARARAATGATVAHRSRWSAHRHEELSAAERDALDQRAALKPLRRSRDPSSGDPSSGDPGDR